MGDFRVSDHDRTTQWGPVSDFLEPISDDEFSRCGGKKRSIVFNVVVRGGLTHYPGVQSADSQLQRSNPVIQNVILGAVEEWAIFNFNSMSHSFHIHVNPMFVTKINGQPIDPYWCDTVALPGRTVLNVAPAVEKTFSEPSFS